MASISNPKAIKVIMLPSNRFSDILSTPQSALSDGSSHTPRSLLRKLLSVMTPAPIDSPQTPLPFIFTPLSKETPHGLVTDPYCSFTESSVTSLYSPLAASTPNGYDSYTYISSSFTINSPDLPVLRDSFPPPLILDDEYPEPEPSPDLHSNLTSPAVVELPPLMKTLTRPSFSWKPLKKSIALIVQLSAPKNNGLSSTETRALEKLRRQAQKDACQLSSLHYRSKATRERRLLFRSEFRACQFRQESGSCSNSGSTECC